jgi:hypothetical protein
VSACRSASFQRLYTLPHPSGQRAFLRKGGDRRFLVFFLVAKEGLAFLLPLRSRGAFCRVAGRERFGFANAEVDASAERRISFFSSNFRFEEGDEIGRLVSPTSS